MHVITIEDPIEYLFSDDVASISQREVGTDTPAFHGGAAERDAPGSRRHHGRRDARPARRCQTVITAAETGHLVFSTLHTNSAAQTIDRILDTFPPTPSSRRFARSSALVLRASCR